MSVSNQASHFFVPRFFRAVLVASSLLLSCSKNRADSSEHSVPSIPSAEIPRLLAAEYARDAERVTAADLSHRNVSHRRHAARALARMAGAGTRSLLLAALHDEDREVVAWAAMGLGRSCSGKDVREVTLPLIARAGTLLLDAPSVGANATTIEPFYAVATALGRCASDEAEATLRSWLSVDASLARHASLGLVELASVRQGLAVETVDALLTSAETYRGFAVAMLPLSRLDRVEPSSVSRLLALVPRLLESSGDERRFLIRALSLAGNQAITVLTRIAKEDASFRPAERVEALRVLGRLGSKGQQALSELIARLIRVDVVPRAAWILSAEYSVLVELLSQLDSSQTTGHRILSKLAELSLGANESDARANRIDWLRCHAAELVAGDDFQSQLIENCASVEGARESKLAVLRVLSRVTIRGRAAKRFDTLLEDDDALVRIMALKLLLSHDEIRERSSRIALALSDPSLGVVATAGEILAKRPELALAYDRPRKELVEALLRAISGAYPEDAVELRERLVDAASALGLLLAKPKIEEACASRLPRLRERAEVALHRLGEPNRRCDAPTTKALPAKSEVSEDTNVTLTFRTVISPLEVHLEPRFAPFAVERIVSLARAGFYDGIAVHRVVPGFVVQLGDKAGDGFGGAGKPPVPGEISPIPFAPFDVGIALSGPDSGASQFFVTLGPYPNLGHEYTRIGRAGTGWDRLALSDIIQKVELSP